MGCGEGAELVLYSLFSTERACNQLYNGDFTFFFSAAHERLLFRHYFWWCWWWWLWVTGKIKRLVPNQTPSAV
jgi:hypothetical protein